MHDRQVVATEVEWDLDVRPPHHDDAGAGTDGGSVVVHLAQDAAEPVPSRPLDEDRLASVS
jgi:hypothetical protein